MIPQRLQVRDVRFVLLEKGGKRPFQQEWQNKKIEYDNLELIQHLSNGGNYGVMGGGVNNLVIIDFDNEKVQEEVCKKLPVTFTVKTGSGKLHKYFFSDKSESFKIFDEQMNTLADVQGEGKQVVGAESTHPNGNKYVVVDDSPISYLPYAEIKALLIPHDKKPKKETKVFDKPKLEIQDDFLDKLKSSLTIINVMNSFGVDTSKNPTACPFHASKGGKCLGFTGEVAHCFHCDGAWNIFSFVKDMKKCDFKEALDYLANLSGLQDELEISRRKYINVLNEKQNNINKEIKSKYLECLKDKKFNEASEILVDWIKEHNYIYTTKDDTKTEMWVYRDGIYVSQGKSEIKEQLRNLLGAWYSAFSYNLCINKLEPDTFIEFDKFFVQNHIDEIALLNGILNIKTRELKSFTPEKIFFSKMPIEYNPQADCPQIDKFLSDVLACPGDKDVFYELGGFCLLNEYIFEKAFMLVGNGRNGKDKSLELLKRLVGLENCVSVPLTSLVSDSFIISEFFGKRMNVAGEIGYQDLKDTTTFKALTGRSIVSAQRKFLRPITFQNNAKFVFACNDLPMVYDSSKGFWDRWVLLLYPFTFVTKEELEKSEQKKLLKLRDERIIEKITTPCEMSGFLNKCLNGLDRLLLNKNFSNTMGSDEIKDLWIRKANSCLAFCLENIENNYEGKISKKEFRKRYIDYCKKHKVSVRSDVVIKRTLQEEYGVSESDNISFGSYERIWEGIAWKN